MKLAKLYNEFRDAMAGETVSFRRPAPSTQANATPPVDLSPEIRKEIARVTKREVREELKRRLSAGATPAKLKARSKAKVAKRTQPAARKGGLRPKPS